MRTRLGFDSLWQDARYAVRVLVKSPAFAIVAVASLALGIGANTAIFQLLDHVRLRTLPVPHPHELADLRIVGGNNGMGLNPGRYTSLTQPIWEEIRRDHPAFAGVFAWNFGDASVGEASERRSVKLLRVSGEFFQVLGVAAFRGRLLEPADETTTCRDSVAVVSHAFWQGTLGGRAITPQTSLVLGGNTVQIVGVAPPGFFGIAVGDPFDVAVPLCRRQNARRDVFNIAVMGRLRPGPSLDQASAQLRAASAGIFEATALTGYSASTIERYRRFTLGAYPAATGVSWLRSEYDTPLQLLFAITGLVLLIACANLANLMLARASTREREVAVRLALGASRIRVVRQLLVESVLLAALGAVCGVGVAQLLSGLLVQSISTTSATVTLPMTVDWRVLLFAAAVATSTCVIFGLIPALRATRTTPAASMKADGRGIAGSRERLSLQRLLVIVQLAVSLVLLVGALLFVRSFRNLTTFDPGFRMDGLLVAYLQFPGRSGPPERHEAFHRQLLDEVRTMPGVTHAATTTVVPLHGNSWTLGIRVPGAGEAAEGSSKFTWVSPDFFTAMGMRLIEGRGFTDADDRSGRRVAVVNQTFVRRYLGSAGHSGGSGAVGGAGSAGDAGGARGVGGASTTGATRAAGGASDAGGAGNAIGRVLSTLAEPNYPAADYEIVGVVADSKYSDVRDETPASAFAPGGQFPELGPWATLVIRVQGTPEAAATTITRGITGAHPGAFVATHAFTSQIRDGLVRERLMAMLSGFFGPLAALLAMLGLYGVIAYLVARRRHEIGIRLALGARPEQVMAMMMREAGRLLIAGGAIGVGLSLLAGRGARALLFGLTPYDPLTLTAACALLGAIAACASWLPARRAARLDPIAALRQD